MNRKVRAPKTKTVAFGFLADRGFPEPMESCDQHNEIELNFIERGEMVFRRGVQTVSLTPGTAIVYWAAIPHQILSVKPKTELSWFTIPLSPFLGWNLPQAFTNRLLHGGILFVPSRATDFPAYPFSDWTKDYSDKSIQRQMAMKLEFEAFFRRLAVNEEIDGTIEIIRPLPESVHCRHVEKMVHYMTHSFTEPLTVEGIAKIAGITPEYAMRIFRERWGITIGKFLVHQRISEAQRLLLLSNTSLIDIAYLCGFQSLSRFYQAFKEHCHCSPGAYRRSHLKGPQ